MRKALTLSLLLNLGLACALWLRAASDSPVPRQPRSEIGRPASRFLKRARSANTPSSIPATPWQKIESSDPAHLIANLRALGCPEQTIREIVTFRICRAYRQKLLAVESEAARKWDYTRERNDWKELGLQRNGLREEMIDSIESLFEKSWASITSTLMGWPGREDHGLDFLTVEDRKRLRELDKRYRQLTEELDHDRQAGTLDSEGRARLRELLRQKRAELADILPPGELDEYHYHHSEAADYVRQFLPPAKSEDEFRKMVKAADELGVSTWRNPPGENESDDDPSVHDYRQQRAALQQRITDILGEDRIAQLQEEEKARVDEEQARSKVETEQHFKDGLVSIAAEAGVPADDASRFFDRLKQSEVELTARFKEIENSLTGTPKERSVKLKAAIVTELEKMAVETMGEKGRVVVQKMAEKDNL